MTKPVVLLPRAARDITDAIDAYRSEGGPALAERWMQALAAALRHVEAHPASGSPRYAQVLALPELRFWRVKRFPYLVFYVECAATVDVWRVLHAHREVPAWLTRSE